MPFFTLTYLNHALLSHLSALGAHRETNLPVIENISQITSQINHALKEAADYPLNRNRRMTTDLSSLLLGLKEQISSTDNSLKKQELRLLYNIAATTTKIQNELLKTDFDRE